MVPAPMSIARMRPSPMTGCYGGTRSAPGIADRRCAVDDKAKGELTKAEGKVKEEFGKVVGDRSTQIGGKVDQLKGEVQSKVGDLEMEAERHDTVDEPASR
jgi:uncharacterized protein YjbJ (UPF0337 family)